jgi:hypothetical protein
MGRHPGREMLADTVLALLSALLCAVAMQQAMQTYNPTGLDGGIIVASLEGLSGEGRHRHQASLVWNGLSVGQDLFEGDTVFVGQDSSASLAFPGGTTVDLHANTLVVIEKPTLDEGDMGGNPTLAVLHGGLSARSKKGKVAIRAGKSRATVGEDSAGSFRVDKKGGLFVKGLLGKLMVQGKGQAQALGKNQAERLDQGGNSLERIQYDVELEKPAADARFFRQPTRTDLTFSWTGNPDQKATFQVARDPRFNRVIYEKVVGEDEIVVQPDFYGEVFWRVLQGGQSPARSDGRRLVVIRDEAPTGLAPAHREILHLRGGHGLSFRWKGPSFAKTFLVEMARDPGFRDIALSRKIQSTRFHLDKPPEEGVYYWRVQVVEPKRAEAPHSRPIRFRVITRPLPRAPELFEPEFDVKKGVQPDGDDSSEAEEPTDDDNPKTGAHDLGPFLKRWAAKVGNLILPAAHAQESGSSAAVVLRWEAVSDVKAYVIQVSSDRRFKNVVKEARVSQNLYRFVPPSLEKEYWFRVKSVDKDGREGEFSKPRKVPAGTRAPTNLSPASGRTMSWREKKPAIKLSWAGSPVAVRYELEISTTSGFSKKLVKEKVKGKTEYVFSPPSVGVYHWRVRMVDVAGTKSAYSRVAKLPVALAAPDPLSPRPKGRVSLGPGQPLGLKWSKRDGTGYEVQLSRRRDFRGKPLKRLTQKNQQNMPVGEDGTWYWRVRAFDSKRAPTPWSKVARFVIALPKIAGQFPEDESVLKSRRPELQVKLRWSAVEGATEYRLEMHRKKEDGSPEQLVRKFKATEGDVSSIEPGDWSWRVTALTDKGPVGPSPEKRFVLERLAPLTAPTVKAPAMEAQFKAGEAITLSWSEVPEATAYELIFGDGDGDERKKVDGASHGMTPHLGWTAWRVRALDQEGIPGPDSDRLRFYSGAPAANAEVVLDPPILNPSEGKEARIRVRLFDEKNKPLRGPEVLARSEVAKVGPFEDKGNGIFEAPVTIDPDIDGHEVPIEVLVHPGPRKEAALGIDRVATLFVGARAGASYNLLDLAGPSVHGELGYRLPFANKVLGLNLTAASHPHEFAAGRTLSPGLHGSLRWSGSPGGNLHRLCRDQWAARPLGIGPSARWRGDFRRRRPIGPGHHGGNVGIFLPHASGHRFFPGGPCAGPDPWVSTGSSLTGAPWL